jgi:hypothetical protein
VICNYESQRMIWHLIKGSFARQSLVSMNNSGILSIVPTTLTVEHFSFVTKKTHFSGKFEGDISSYLFCCHTFYFYRLWCLSFPHKLCQQHKTSSSQTQTCEHVFMVWPQASFSLMIIHFHCEKDWLISLFIECLHIRPSSHVSWISMWFLVSLSPAHSPS